MKLNFYYDNEHAAFRILYLENISRCIALIDIRLIQK